MIDATNLPNKSFSRNNFYRTSGLKPPRRHMTPDPHLARMRTLNKHIQHHNITQILGDTQVALDARTGDNEMTIDEKKEVSANLTGLRKKFDETRDVRSKKEKEINWMRAEIEKLKFNEQFLKDDVNKDSSKLEHLQNSVEAQKIRIEEAMLSRSSYMHMLDRLKKDKIADKIKVANLQNMYNKGTHDLTHEELNARRAKQFHLQAKTVFDDVIKQVELEERKRQESLDVFEHTLHSKEEVERKREERIKRTQDIAENAAAEIRDSNEKKWRELMMVHKFLASFLKKKMDREMKQYEGVERAFQKIKASTGLADAKEIVTKFVRREDTYSELLISIANYEKKIEELKKTNDTLKSKVHGLKEKNVPFERQRNEREGDLNQLIEAYKDLHLKTETYKQAKLKIEKVRDWSIKTLLKIDKAQNLMIHDYYQIFPKDKVVESFLKVVETVHYFLTSAKEVNVNQILSEIDAIRMEEVEDRDFIAKNVRVKSSIGRARSKSIDSHTNSRGNLSRDGSEHDSDDKSMDETEEDLDKYLSEQRKEIKIKAQEDMIRRKKLKEREEEEKAKAK